MKDVHVRFPINPDWLGRPRQHVHALNGISIDVARGDILGIVGESGCGKSTLAQILVGLLKPTSGSLQLAKQDAATRSGMQIVFQDPQSSLNPKLPVWKIITEPVYALGDRPSQQAMMDLAKSLAIQVGIRPEYIYRFPHEFSGGQRQRIAIARALSTNPEIILLDEPTSALDISVQAQILNLLQELQRSRNMTFILISHNVSVIRHMCNRTAVMYLGQIVEVGATLDVLENPRHPYTQLLMESVPKLSDAGFSSDPAEKTELPSNIKLPAGCFFKDRCARATSGCQTPQALVTGEPRQTGHQVRCHLAYA
ncbi:ABC transporter ATP-binding protein [Crenobacter intestini]|uniref:ABC transporter ATP-binding protein n=2 Tax=Crenobacter intestini TaxID=2563443 RepID=A0A4T0V7P0_9NEIS|nr:ABC transporter ATP-binding protein [Crenobacter intestini]